MRCPQVIEISLCAHSVARKPDRFAKTNQLPKRQQSDKPPAETATEFAYSYERTCTFSARVHCTSFAALTMCARRAHSGLTGIRLVEQRSRSASRYVPRCPAFHDHNRHRVALLTCPARLLFLARIARLFRVTWFNYVLEQLQLITPSRGS